MTKKAKKSVRQNKNDTLQMSVIGLKIGLYGY